MEMSKKIAVNLIKIPNIESINKCYLKTINPTTKIEKFLIINNIHSIKDVNSFPFVDKIIKSNDLDYNFLIKYEQYEILINKDHVEPSLEFEQAINGALKSMKPFKALQGVFDEYGYLFPQKIILGRIFKKKTLNADFDKIDIKSPISESLKPYLNHFDIPYLLTQEGNIIQENDLYDLIQDSNNKLEIIEFDDVISLYKILEEQQQRRIDIILDSNDYDRNH